MKDINFIPTLPPREQHAIRRWYQITVAGIIFTIIGICSAHAFQYYMWRTMQQKTVRFDTATYTKVEEEIKQLQEKETFLKAYATRTQQYQKSMATWVGRLGQLTTRNLDIHTMDMNTKTAQLTLHIPSIDKVKEVMQQLHACACIKKVTLHSVQPIHNGKMYECRCSCEWSFDTSRLR